MTSDLVSFVSYPPVFRQEMRHRFEHFERPRRPRSVYIMGYLWMVNARDPNIIVDGYLWRSQNNNKRNLDNIIINDTTTPTQQQEEKQHHASGTPVNEHANIRSKKRKKEACRLLVLPSMVGSCWIIGVFFMGSPSEWGIVYSGFVHSTDQEANSDMNYLDAWQWHPP